MIVPSSTIATLYREVVSGWPQASRKTKYVRVHDNPPFTSSRYMSPERKQMPIILKQVIGTGRLFAYGRSYRTHGAVLDF
jgi:hypothetical protein